MATGRFDEGFREERALQFLKTFWEQFNRQKNVVVIV
jgi:hypothetical protein